MSDIELEDTIVGVAEGTIDFDALKDWYKGKILLLE